MNSLFMFLNLLLVFAFFLTSFTGRNCYDETISADFLLLFSGFLDSVTCNHEFMLDLQSKNIGSRAFPTDS